MPKYRSTFHTNYQPRFDRSIPGRMPQCNNFARNGGPAQSARRTKVYSYRIENAARCHGPTTAGDIKTAIRSIVVARAELAAQYANDPGIDTDTGSSHQHSETTSLLT